MEPFAIGATVDVGGGGTVVRGRHAMLVAVREIDIELLDGKGVAEYDGLGARRVQGPDESGHEVELGMVAVDGLAGWDVLWEWWDQTC